MSMTACVQLGWEDLGPQSAFSIYVDRNNPFDNSGRCHGGRSRLVAMFQIGMRCDRCELCGKRGRLQGVAIDEFGPERPENFLALCDECAGEWVGRRV